MSAGGAGPAALLFGGGRASLGGEPLDPGGARRYRELTQGAGVPTYVLPGPGDVPGGGAEAFASAFATAPAPQGTGEAPEGVDLLTVTQPERGGPRPGAEHVRVRRQGRRGHRPGHRHRQRRGPPRRRARRSAGASGSARRWSRRAWPASPRSWSAARRWTTARTRSPPRTPTSEIALLAGHASAYVATAGVDDPADRFFGGVLSRNVVQVPGAAAPLPLLQSSTLGYAPSQRFTNDPEDELATRQTDAALLMIDVGVGRLDPTTGVAPVDVVSEPLLQGLAIDEGSRAIPLGWAIPLFITASDPSPRRFLMSPGPNEPLRPASPRAGTGPMVDQCRFFLDRVRTVVPTALAFSSAEPADRALRRGPPRRARDRGSPPGRPRRLRARHRRSPRLLLPARARDGRRHRDRPGPARHDAGPRDSGPEDRRCIRATAIPPGTCAFPNLDVSDDEPKPAATPQAPAGTTPPAAADPAPAPADPQPQPQPAQPKPETPAPAPVPATPIPGARRAVRAARGRGARHADDGRCRPPAGRARTQAPGAARPADAAAGPPGPGGRGAAGATDAGDAARRAAPRGVRASRPTAPRSPTRTRRHRCRGRSPAASPCWRS